ncbi:putative aminotransferase YugH [Procambarus clarkii]|uniref:putative aminotransferase YugH n=1 Tax=Procambarus clarkii TaxID=6728 RepID=UPI0037437853
MKSLSKVSANIDGQPMFKYLDKARALEAAGRDLIHMEIGEPDFDTPKNVVDAAVSALLSGDTHYCSSYGLTEFREAIQYATERSRGFTPDISQVLVTPGANISIYYATLCLVDPGCEVIVPNTGFSTYYSTLKMCGVIPVEIPLRESNGFKPDPMELESLITDKTRMIIVNSPHNPTGSVLSSSDMKAIYDLAVKYDLYLYSDEIYARMSYDDQFSSPSIYDQCRDRVIVSNGFSKSYAMTGWRLGTMIGPEIVIERIAALLQTTSSCVSPFIQRAGIEAIRGNTDEVDAMMAEYKARRDMLVSGLNRIRGFECQVPGGAFYVFPNIVGTGYSSDDVVNMLMDGGVVALPGHCFGSNGEGNIRLCYATSRDKISEALLRIEQIFGVK